LLLPFLLSPVFLFYCNFSLQFASLPFQLKVVPILQPQSLVLPPTKIPSADTIKRYIQETKNERNRVCRKNQRWGP
jgi:hypothetical protein